MQLGVSLELDNVIGFLVLLSFGAFHVIVIALCDVLILHVDR